MLRLHSFCCTLCENLNSRGSERQEITLWWRGMFLLSCRCAWEVCVSDFGLVSISIGRGIDRDTEQERDGRGGYRKTMRGRWSSGNHIFYFRALLHACVCARTCVCLCFVVSRLRKFPLLAENSAANSFQRWCVGVPLAHSMLCSLSSWLRHMIISLGWIISWNVFIYYMNHSFPILVSQKNNMF